MAGKTPHEAVQNYLDPIRKALSCVTREVVQVGGGYHPSAAPHILALAGNSPVRLGDARVALSVGQQYLVIEDTARGPWRVSTASYSYALLDWGAQEIVAYHWHPFTGVAFPHLHLRGGAEVMRVELTKAHLPTGRMSIEQVIRFGITELGAEPLRPDWDAVLAETQGRFEADRTWS